MMVALERARQRYTIRRQIRDYTRHLEQGLDRTTRRLEETVAYPDRLIESSMDGICGTDASGKVAIFNRSMEQMLGMPRDQVIGRLGMDHFFSPVDFARFESDLTADGHGGAHEINTPLTGILNYIRLILRDFRKGPLPAGQQETFAGYLALVETKTDRCSKIVSSPLTFSRKSPISMEPVAVDDVVARSLVLARHRLELGHITLVSRTTNGLPAITGDANQLQQCLLNLILNAVDAMPGGGKLTLATAVEEHPRCVLIQVSDTGHGIRKEDLGHVFEPFYTTKAAGCGISLGLSTTYGIIERHGGTLTVDSRPGQGATFTIRLPLPPLAEHAG